MSTEKAMAKAVEALYFGDGSDYETALWQIVDALGGQKAVDMLEDDEEQAYSEYVVGAK